MVTDIDNLMGMARTADTAGNSEEALSYYNRVLELEPKLPEAWLGKGRAAGLLSTLAVLRTHEMTVAFGNAIGSADESSRAGIAELAAKETNEIAVMLYGAAREHVEEFASVDGTWSSYLVQVAQLVDAMEVAHEWKPSDPQILKNIIHLCKDNIEGYVTSDPMAYDTPVTLGVSEEYEHNLRDKMDMATLKLKQIEPDYEPPQIVKKESDGCFIATAAAGSHDDNCVFELRLFRDQVLQKTATGRRFIIFYYRRSPPIANFISSSASLKFFVYYGFVYPISVAAKYVREKFPL